MTIEIYVLGRTKNPAVQKKAVAGWMIVCMMDKGRIEKRNGLVCLENATPKKAALTALSQALQRFNRPAMLKIYISDDFVRASLVNGWTGRWKTNNWHKIRYNGQLAHKELWKDVVTRLSNHAVSYARLSEFENNKYINEMEWRLKNVKG